MIDFKFENGGMKMISVVLLMAMLLFLGILPNSLSILAFSAIIIILIYQYPVLFLRPVIIYLFSICLGSLSLLFPDNPFSQYLLSGIMGYGVMVIVMFVGVLPNSLTLTRVIKKHRGELSILTFILITPHVINHLLILKTINLFGVVAFVLMVPLTFISFKVIKREISSIDWNRIQKVAYLVYISLFIHLVYVSSYDNKIIYAILFTLYVNNKILKEVKK